MISALAVVKGGVLNGLSDIWYIAPETIFKGMIHSLFGGKAIYHGEQSVWMEAPKNMTVEQFADAGMPDVNGGIIPCHIERVKYMVEILSQFENLSKVAVLAVDSYGLLETACALLDTTQLLLDMMTQPKLVESFFDIMLETTIKYNTMIEDVFQKEIAQGRVKTFRNTFSACYEYRLVEDSAILLSPDLYAQFCRKYNEILFETYKVHNVITYRMLSSELQAKKLSGS